ncbi:MAG: TonB-dependent receptor [Deltaproteobacteria bacterium]|nr:TonB-dependent receptor [Deltaproteobacteria bacterium]
MRRQSFVSVLFFVCLSASAQGYKTSLGEIVVQKPTSTTPSSPIDSSVSTTIIEGKDLQGQKTSLPEVLSETAGLQIRQYGGLDAFATASIRGSTSEQVAVYLDGLLLNTVQGGDFNLASIPVNEIERIEIYRGAVPARLGTSALGGAILIRTRSAELKKGHTTRLSTSYGSFNTLETSIFQAQKLRSSHYAANYSLTRTDGDFSFLNNNGTPFNSSDDRTEKRENNDLTRHKLLLKMGRSLANGSLEFQENFLREERGIPGLGALTSEKASLSSTRTVTQLRWQQGEWSLAPFLHFEKQRFKDQEGEIGLGIQDNSNNTWGYGFDSSLERMIGRFQRGTLVMNYRGEQFLPEDFSSSTPEVNSLRNQFGIGLEDEIVLLEERIILNPSLRTEHILNNFSSGETNFHPVSGKMGVRFHATPSVVLRTNFARAYRIPSFSELFGDRGSLLGNPDLQPEKGWNGDIGFSWETSPLSFSTAYFLNQTEDMIQFLQTSQLTARAENLTKARIQGVETDVRIPLSEQAAFSANYTFQRAKDASGFPGTEGKFLPGRPVHEASGRLHYRYRMAQIYTDLTYLDNNFLDTQNILRTENRFLWGSGISISPVKWLTTSFDVKNILSDQVVDVVGFPLPGRSFYGRLEANI